MKERITASIAATMQENDTALVLFQGAPCSGKTTLMTQIHNEFKDKYTVSVQTYEKAEESLFGGTGKVSRAILHGAETEERASTVLAGNIRELIAEKGIIFVEAPGHGYVHPGHDYGRTAITTIMKTSLIPVHSIYSLGNAEFYRSKPFKRDRQAFFDEQYGYGGASESIMQSLLENYGLFVMAAISEMETVTHYIEAGDAVHAGWPFTTIDAGASDIRIRALDQLRITEEVRQMNNGLVQIYFHYPYENAA